MCNTPAKTVFVREIFVPILCVLVFVIFQSRCSQEDFWNDLTAVSAQTGVTASPVSGSFLGKSGFNHEITLYYTYEMDQGSLQLSGAMAAEASSQWTSGRTLKIYPATQWTTSPKTGLTVKCNDKEGSPVNITLSYGIFESVICVSKTGNPANSGSRDMPKNIIQDGIAAASAAGTPSVVIVSEGDYNAPGIVANMVNGVSLYGGYSASDWDKRDSAKYITRMNDTRTSTTGTSITNNTTLRTVNFVGAMTNTVLDGFTIHAAQIDDNLDEAQQAASAAVYIDGASPAIRNNKINGNMSKASETRITSAAVVIRGTIASPVLSGNTINGGDISSDYVSNSTEGRTIGIYIVPAVLSATTVYIQNNSINGGSSNGSGGMANAVYFSNTSPEITGNVINAGSSTSNNTNAVMMTTSPGRTCSSVIRNNTINGGTAQVNATGFWISGDSTGTTMPVIEKNTINGGAGKDNVYGLYVTSYSNPSLIDNTITIDSCDNNTYAVSINAYAFAAMKGNTIDAGTGVNITTAVRIINGEAKIWNNIINGGKGSAISTGIDINGGLFAGESVTAKIWNNAVNGGSGNNSYCINMANTNTNPFAVIIENNLIFSDSASVSKWGVRENDAMSNPSDVNCNNFFNCDTHYWDDAATAVILEPGLNALSGSSSAGNIIEDIYADIIGSDEYRFTGDLSAFTFDTGGIDGSGAGWGFNDDRDGTVRSAPWSIGPYEY